MASKITLPHKEIVTKWKEEKVIKWLRRVHLEDCIPAFEVRHIDGEKLLELTEQKLFTYQDLKIKHRKQIAKCVQECKSQASNAKRIARTIKQRKDSSLEGPDISDNYDSEDDPDDWGSDFDDESENEEETDNLVCELNNNTILQSSIVSNSDEQNTDGNSNIERGPLENFIPKPPDIPVIPAVINSPNIRNVPSHKSSLPRPPVKRPPGQPPPPPVSQASSQDLEQEDYEIPIVSTAPFTRENSELCDSPVHCMIPREETSAETYELIVPPEETYEIVDTPSHLPNVVEKPALPPRIPLSSSSVSPPPPLPQKPKKIKASMAVLDRPTEIRTLTRPKPFSKSEVEPQSSSVSSIIGTLIGRRSSSTSSPKSLHKIPNDGGLGSSHSVVSSSDGMSSRSSSPDRDVGHPPFLITSSITLNITKTAPLPPLPVSSGAAISSDEAAQNLATRPLPPVPAPKVEKSEISHQENLQAYPWYHEMERQEAEEVVRNLNESGSFVVRPSKRAGIENPFSITIFHDEKLFHLNIRHRPDNKFALGKEKKKEKTFSSVADLIAFHQKEPILLTSRGEPAGKTILSKFPEKSSS